MNCFYSLWKCECFSLKRFPRSYEDMTRAASIAQQALDKGYKPKALFTVSPGSEQIRATMERDGLTETFNKLGATVLANACGPCIGQWNRSDIVPGEENSIIASFNRNFTSRNDGNAATHNFLASPEIVVALALAGDLSFNPETDSLTLDDGSTFKLEPPQGVQLPPRGFDTGRTALSDVEADESGEFVVKIDPASDRLQALDPFPAWDGNDFLEMPVLVKAKGKCTTDHISAAGAWLKYKGHLENIAKNTLIGAVNADNDKVNVVTSQLSGREGTIPEVAEEYKAAGVPWVVITDRNYGEGSAREHAAMQPRFLGCKCVIARSFARIHETNLKKQGVLPLTFKNEDDYNLVSGADKISVVGLAKLAPGAEVEVRVHKQDGETIQLAAVHTFSEEQLEWFKAGSALNAAAASS